MHPARTGRVRRSYEGSSCAVFIGSPLFLSGVAAKAWYRRWEVALTSRIRYRMPLCFGALEGPKRLARHSPFAARSLYPLSAPLSIHVRSVPVPRATAAATWGTEIGQLGWFSGSGGRADVCVLLVDHLSQPRNAHRDRAGLARLHPQTCGAGHEASCPLFRLRL